MIKFKYLNIILCLFFLLGSLIYINGGQTNETSTTYDNVIHQDKVMNHQVLNAETELRSVGHEISPSFDSIIPASIERASQNGISYSPHGLSYGSPSIQVSSTQYNVSTAISIIGDSGFSGFPGSGTLVDPYRIEGWNITASSGSLIYVSGTTAHFTIGNNLLNGMTTAYRGIYLLNVINGTIRNNYVGNFTSSGIRMESSINNTITDNTVYNNQGWAGVEIRYSSDTYINNNTIFNNYNGNGISFYFSNNNLLTNNTAHSNNYRGIRLEYSDNNEIINNAAYNNNEDGIWLWYSDSNLIANNTAYSNTFVGIRVERSNINNISSNNVFDNQGWTGMWLASSNSNTITNNTAYSNNGNGIDITESNANILSNNTAYNNKWAGINLWTLSINNIVSTNTLYNNTNGIMLTSSTLNTISSNNAYDNNYGLFLLNSGNNVILNNNFTSNGILVVSSIVEDSLQQSVLNNLVNGKPLIYLQSVIGGIVQSGAGQVILINCTGVTVINQNITNASIGIFVGYSSGIILDSNQLSNQRYGISLRFADDNLLVNNTNHKILFQDITLEDSDNNILRSNYLLSNNSLYGHTFLLGKLFLERSDDNSIINNTISNSLNDTIRLIDSHNNAITSNLISNNTGYGIISDDLSQGNVIQLNDFIDNNIGGSQVFDDGINIFEYNHWSDWTSPDSDVDGFVDGPYLLEGLSNNNDPFPLVISTSNHYLLPPPVLTSPIDGQTFSKSITLNWKQSIDTWGFAVTFNFFYSNDGGTTWNLVATDIIDNSLIWDIRTVTDGSNYKIKINATSLGGLTNSFIMTNTFSIDQTPPTVVIESPLTGTITNNVIEITLSGDAINYWFYIEPVYTANLTWAPSLIAMLDDGTYTLHAYGNDPVGNIAHVQVTFTIDSTPPTVIIEAPISETYTSEVVTITLSGDATTYWYNIESVDATDQIWTSSVTRTLADGTYTLHAYGSDSAGNIAHVQITFTIATPVSSSSTPTTTTTSKSSTSVESPTKKSDESAFPFTRTYIILLSIFTMLTLTRNKKSSKSDK
ncbi:MAG: NosD domain-containing protein [Candidatus Kariarchaeaceae archaeon]|jgi:parallel beta-helix repeat protein